MIEHGAATVPSQGSDRSCDLSILADHGVFALSAGGGQTGPWAARKCLDIVRVHADALARTADDAAAGDVEAEALVLERMQSVFDDAAWALYEEAHASGHATRGELGLVVLRPGVAWIGMSGECAALMASPSGLQRLDHAGGSLRLGRVPLGVHTSAEPELFRHALAPGHTLLVGSSTRLHALTFTESGHMDCQRLAQKVATGLVGPRGEGAAIALRGEPRESARDLVASVASTRLAQGLDSSVLRRLEPYLLERRLDAGHVVFREGDPGERLYLILAGSVSVHRADTPLVELGAGDHFGELALHLAGVRTATVTTTAPTWLASLHRRQLRDLEERRPDVAVVVQRRLLQHLAERLAELTERVVE